MENLASVAQPKLFNSSLETGLRAIILLEAMYPRVCSLTELTWFDHLVVHTGDFGGPQSLHPDLPGRTGELLVRRRLVEQSLRLMQRVHLVDELHTPEGVAFIASEDAPSFASLLESSYCHALKDRAEWIAEKFRSVDTAEIERQVNDRIGRWAAEFTSGSMDTTR